jgi:hypothetical protein
MSIKPQLHVSIKATRHEFKSTPTVREKSLCPRDTYLRLEEAQRHYLNIRNLDPSNLSYPALQAEVMGSPQTMRAWKKFLVAEGLITEDNKSTGKEVPSNMFLCFLRYRRVDVIPEYLGDDHSPPKKGEKPSGKQIGYRFKPKQEFVTGMMVCIQPSEETLILPEGAIYECTCWTKVGGYLEVGEVTEEMAAFFETPLGMQIRTTDEPVTEGSFVKSRLLNITAVDVVPPQGGINELLNNIHGRLRLVLTRDVYAARSSMGAHYRKAIGALSRALFVKPNINAKRTEDGDVFCIKCGQYQLANTGTAAAVTSIYSKNKDNTDMFVREAIRWALTHFADACAAVGPFEKNYTDAQQQDDVSLDHTPPANKRVKADKADKTDVPVKAVKSKAKGKKSGDKRKMAEVKEAGSGSEYEVDSDEEEEEGASGGKMHSVGKRHLQRISAVEADELIQARTVLAPLTLQRLQATIPCYFKDYDLLAKFGGGLLEVIRQADYLLWLENNPDKKDATFEEFQRMSVRDDAKNEKVYSEVPYTTVVVDVFSQQEIRLVEENFIQWILVSFISGFVNADKRMYHNVTVNDRWCYAQGMNTCGNALNVMSNMIGALMDTVSASMRSEQWMLLCWLFITEERSTEFVSQVPLVTRISLYGHNIWEFLDAILASILRADQVESGIPKDTTLLANIITNLAKLGICKMLEIIKVSFHGTPLWYKQRMTSRRPGVPEFPLTPRMKFIGDRFWGSLAAHDTILHFPDDLPVDNKEGAEKKEGDPMDADKTPKKKVRPFMTYTDEYFGRFEISGDLSLVKYIDPAKVIGVENAAVRDFCLKNAFFVGGIGSRVSCIPTRKEERPDMQYLCYMYEPENERLKLTRNDMGYFAMGGTNYTVKAEAQYLLTLLDNPKFYIVKDKERQARLVEGIRKFPVACARNLLLFLNNRRSVVETQQEISATGTAKTFSISVFLWGEGCPEESRPQWDDFVAENGAKPDAKPSILDCVAMAVLYDWKDSPNNPYNIGYDPTTGRSTVFPYLVRAVYADKEYKQIRIISAEQAIEDGDIKARVRILCGAGGWVDAPVCVFEAEDVVGF